MVGTSLVYDVVYVGLWLCRLYDTDANSKSILKYKNMLSRNSSIVLLLLLSSKDTFIRGGYTEKDKITAFLGCGTPVINISMGISVLTIIYYYLEVVSV